MKRAIFFSLCLCASSLLWSQTTYEQYVEQAIALAEADSLEQAEECFKQALKLAPKDYRNALVFNNLGRVQEKMYWKNPKNHQLADRALENYTLALGLTPTSVPMLEARASFYLKLSNYSRALMDYTTILDVASNNIEARNYRAYCYAQLRRYDEAKADYQRILAQDANNYSALLGLAVLLQNTQKLQEAIEHASALITIYPDKAELYSVRAAMYAEHNQPELALMDLDKAVELDSTNMNYVLARAYLYQQQGNNHRAKQDFDRAIELGMPAQMLKKERKSTHRTP